MFSANYGGFAVNELDIKNILFGGINVHMTSDEGMNFNQTTERNIFNNGEFVHADIRAAENHNGVFWVMTDGFLAKSTDNGVNWEYFEGHGIRENYRLGVSQSNHYRTIVGSQDNGTSIKTENGWIAYWGGDGMEGIIHPLNDDWMIGSTQNGESWLSTKNGGLSSEEVSPTGGGSFWVAPLLCDPNDPMTIYSIEKGIHKSDDFGTTWDPVISASSFSNAISAAAIAPNNSNVIVATDSDFISESLFGSIKKSIDGGQTFSSIKGTAPNALPGGFITDVAFDPLDDNVIVVTRR